MIFSQDELNSAYAECIANNGLHRTKLHGMTIEISAFDNENMNICASDAPAPYSDDKNINSFVGAIFKFRRSKIGDNFDEWKFIEKL
ncbi:hypothetical protein ACO0K2_11695 [Undibacterium sp. MH2W]|uniref:hypothetical protein n=1 Tax=Undibacterium sp. MH2W TaxID=3413044 RepID=UPI003BF41234